MTTLGANSKLTAERLARKGVVYLRQSSSTCTSSGSARAVRMSSCRLLRSAGRARAMGVLGRRRGGRGRGSPPWRSALASVEGRGPQ